jgi:succinate-acetate transporter protein
MPSPVDSRNRNIVDNRWFRLLLFPVTFALAPLIIFGPGSLPFYPLLLAFPAGVVAFFYQNVNEMSPRSALLGWLIYIGISFIAILTKKRSLFTSLYVIFLLLLIVNFAGCNRIIENRSFGF